MVIIGDLRQGLSRFQVCRIYLVLVAVNYLAFASCEPDAKLGSEGNQFPTAPHLEIACVLHIVLHLYFGISI